MTEQPDAPANRLERRKQRTRAALITAAQALHRRGQAQRPGAGDHPGRRRRDGLVLQPLQTQGATLRRRRRGRPRRPRRRARPAHRDIDDPAETFAQQLPAHRPAVPPQARRRARSCCTTAWPLRRTRPRAARPPRHRSRRPRRTVHRRRPRTGACIVAGGALLGSASCCATNPSATTPRPPTRSPRTCCGCSASRRRSPRDLPAAAARPRRATARRYGRVEGVQPIIGRWPAVMAPCFLRGRRLTEGPTSDCSPGQVDLRGDTLGTHQDRNSPS